MLHKTITIKNKYGIHARPSSRISEIVNEFNSQVIIKYNNNEADASSVMNLILLSIEPNSTVELVADGNDEHLVFEKLVQYLEAGIIEEEIEHP